MKVINKSLLSLILVLTMFTSVFNVNYVVADETTQTENVGVDTNEKESESSLVDASQDDDTLEANQADNQSEDETGVVVLDETGDTNQTGDGSSNKESHELTKDKNKLAFNIYKSKNTETNQYIPFTTSDKLEDGEQILIVIDLTLANSDLEYKKQVIDLGQCLEIKDLLENANFSLNGDQYGSYTLDTKTVTDEDGNSTTNKTVVATYDNEALKRLFPNQNEYIVSIEMTAEANLGDDAVPDDNGNCTINIGGTPITIPFKVHDSLLSLKKQSLGDGSVDAEGNANENIVKVDDYFYMKFSLTATSTIGDNKSVVINDSFDSDKIEFVLNDDEHPITLKINNETKDVTNIVKIDQNKLTATISELSKDSNAVIEYWARFKVSDYANVNGKKNSASSTYTNNNGTENNKVEATPYQFALDNIGIEKSVAVADAENTEAGQKKLLWTIVVKGCAYNDGYVFTDSETLDSTKSDDSTRLIKNGTVEITKNNSDSWKLSYEQFSSGTLKLSSGNETPIGDYSSNITHNKDNPILITLNSTDTLTIKYINTYDISNVDIRNGFNAVNDAWYENEALGIKKSGDTKVEATYGIVPGRKIKVTKKHINYELVDGKNVITWQVDVTVPVEFSNIVLKDTPGTGLTMDTSSLTYTNGSGDNSFKEENGKYKISLNTNNPKKDTINSANGDSYDVYVYTMTYKTTLDRGQTLSNIENKVGFDYEYEGTQYSTEEEKNSDNDYSLIISKTGNTLGSTTGKQEWKIEINLEVLTDLDNKSFKLTETIPDNLRLLANTTILGNETVSVLKEDKTGTFEIDLTNALKSYKNNHQSDKTVTFSFNTEFIGLNIAANKSDAEDDYTNNVKATYGDSETDEASGTAVNCTFKPEDVFKKTYEYKASSPTIVSYTIEVNPSEISIAKQDNDTISITDKIGSSLMYKESTIKVVDKNSKAVNFKKKVTDHTMEISDLPDKTHLIITYDCVVNLKYGTDTSKLTSSEIGNDASFDGVDGIDFDSKSDMKNTIQNGANASIKPTSTSITIYKTNEDGSNYLEGAKFKVYIVKYVNGEFVEANKDEITGYNGSQTASTDSEGKVVFSGLLFNQYYCYEEISAPDSYELSEDNKGYVLFDGLEADRKSDDEISQISSKYNLTHMYNYITSIETSMTNKLATDADITIKKVIAGNTDILTDENLKNSISFVVKDKIDNTSKTIELSSSNCKLENNVYSCTLKNMPFHEYTIEENVKDVTGYTLKNATYSVKDIKGNTKSGEGKSYTFTLDWKNVEVTFTNTYIDKEYPVTISKIDSETNKLLEDATLDLYKVVNGKEESVKTITSSKEIINLSKGNYVLKETNAPTGYVQAKDIEFVVEKDGTVKVNGEDVKSEIKMIDEHTNQTITIKKVIEGDTDIEKDENFKKSISFKITDNTSNKSQTIDLTSFNYDESTKTYLYEINSKSFHNFTIEEIVNNVTGYDYVSDNSNNSQTIDLKDKDLDVTFTNEYKDHKYPISIAKKDSDTLELLSGATLEIYKVEDDTRTKVGTINTTNEISKLELPKGNYVIVETKAPDYFEIANELPFTVKKDGTIKVNDKTVEVIDMIDNHIIKKVELKFKVNGVSYHSLRSMKFRITNKTTGKSEEVSMLDDFKYDETEEVYTYTLLANLNAEYSIEEISNTLSGYNLNVANDNKGSSSTTFTVDDTQLSIEFVNTYKKIETKAPYTPKSCKDAIGEGWTWSERSKTCVYKVGNTSSK